MVSDVTPDASTDAAGREMADRLKREARLELPGLLAMWDGPPAVETLAAAS